MSSERDWRPMDEDVSMHTMGRYMQHEDGRACCYHHRLGMWVFGWLPTSQCLRDHPDRAARADQHDAEEGE